MPIAEIAILLFQVAQERNFIHDDLISAASAELHRRGIENAIYETTLPALDAPDADDLSALDDLAARVRGRYAVCAYTRLWSASAFARLRAALPGATWVYLGDPRVAFAGTDYTLAAAQVPALVEIARAVAEGRPPDLAVLALPPMDLTAQRGGDNLVRIAVGRNRPDRPAVLHGSPGCAYSADVRENPAFRGLEFPARVVTRGCSFCASGGVARRPASEVLASVLEQLDNVFATAPETARVQVNDQNPFPYLVRLVERVSARARRPVEVLIETRVDWFLGALPVMERALAAAERAGHAIVLFLVGIENLSQKELDLYNKGVTVAENERAIHACRRLRTRYPRGWAATPGAFGFVLYNPWTELGDLALNAFAVERTGFGEFRGQVARSKLRLYPDTALYYKARAEGLLADRFPYPAMDSARRYGYEAEVPWRFKHAATDTAYGAHDAIFRRLGKHEEMPMLLEIVRYLQRHPEAAGQPAAAVARAVVAGMGSRFVRTIRHDT